MSQSCYGRTNMETVSHDDRVFLESSHSLFCPLPIALLGIGCSASLLFFASCTLAVWTAPFLPLHLRIYLTLIALAVFVLPLWSAIRRVVWRPICHGRIDISGVTAYDTFYPWPQIQGLDCVWLPLVGHQWLIQLRPHGWIKPIRYVPTCRLSVAKIAELSDELAAFLSTHHPHVRISRQGTAPNPQAQSENMKT